MLQLVQQALAFVTTILSVVEFIRGQTDELSKWITGTSRSLLGDSILGQLYDNAETGASEAFLARSSLSAMRTGSALTLQDILDAIAAIPTGGLTTEEHDQLMALANLDYDTIAYYVWNKATSLDRINGYNTGLPTQTLLESVAAWFIQWVGWRGMPLPQCHWFSLVTSYPDALVTGGYRWDNYSTVGRPAAPDWSQWQQGDTPYTFLARTQPAFGWVNTGPAGSNDGKTAWKPSSSPPTLYVSWFRSNFTELEAEVQHVSSGATIEIGSGIEVTVPPQPPIWPGDDLVTLGTPVALVDQLVITAPMDGVLISITTPPTRTGRHVVGTEIYYYGVGELAFESDNGDLEQWQYFGFTSMIATPKTMTRASRVRFRVLGGAEGTVTPWTVS